MTAEYPIPGYECTALWATGNASHAEVCYHHYERALDWFYKRRIELPEQNRLMIEEAERKAAEKARLAAEARSIIYYLRREDGMIKIGVTGSYKNRLKSLQSEHGKLQLLLAYSGTRQEEREAHRQFYRERIRRSEWFRPELRLLLEIQRLRNAWNGRPSKLPEQVPVAEIKAIIKAIRDQQREAAA
jgi:hypothetical protein